MDVVVGGIEDNIFNEKEPGHNHGGEHRRAGDGGEGVGGGSMEVGL